MFLGCSSTAFCICASAEFPWSPAHKCPLSQPIAFLFELQWDMQSPCFLSLYKNRSHVLIQAKNRRKFSGCIAAKCLCKCICSLLLNTQALLSDCSLFAMIFTLSSLYSTTLLMECRSSLHVFEYRQPNHWLTCRRTEGRKFSLPRKPTCTAMKRISRWVKNSVSLWCLTLSYKSPVHSNSVDGQWKKKWHPHELISLSLCSLLSAYLCWLDSCAASLWALLCSDWRGS